MAAATLMCGSTPLAAQYDEEREKTFLEGLNTLYVAFTRPRHRLYVLSKRPEDKRKAAADGEPGAPTTAARNVAATGDRFEPTVESAEAVAPVHDEQPREQPQQRRRQPRAKADDAKRDGDAEGHVDVRA